MKFQLGPITVTHLIATNFELICKTIALLFDEELERFLKFQSCPITVTDLIARKFELICKPIALLFDEKLEKFYEVST